MPQNNTTLTEIGPFVLATVLAIGGIVLLYVSKIDIAFATSMFILAAGLLGFTGALKAPSPTQQQQISTQQAQIGEIAQGQQQLTSQVLSTIPAIVQAQQPAQAQQPVPPMTVQSEAPPPFSALKAPLSDFGLPPVPQQQFKSGGTFEQPIVGR